MQNTADTQKRPEFKEERCPECHAVILVHPNYVKWCDQCGWNLQPHKPSRPQDVLGSLYASMGARLSRSLFDRVTNAESLKPTWTFSKALAFLLATVVHGLTLALAALGGVLLVKGWPYFFAIAGGLLCLLVAWALRPRPARWPDATALATKFPTLHKTVNRVAQALGTSGVDAIVIDEQFNAAFGHAGWRRKKVLRLGLPLLSILDDQEKVALIAHELAHNVNGDPHRGFLIGSAIDALVTWSELLQPDVIWPLGHGIRGVLMVPLNLAMLGLSRIAWLGAYVLVHLLWRESQRAEYLADYLASGVCGTDAMLSMLERAHYEAAFSSAVQRAAVSQTSLDLFAELQRRIAEMPSREIERVRRVERLEASRLDATHPPTVCRVEFLKARRVSGRKVVLSPIDSNQLGQEFAAIQKTIQRKLVDAYIASISR